MAALPAFPLHRADPHLPIQIVCFAYAGAGATAFKNWSSSIPNVEVLALDFPGRGKLFNEPPLKTVPELAAFAVKALRGVLNRPFAMFGHSLGAAVAYEVALKLDRDPSTPLRGVFVSGRSAPHVRRKARMFHQLTRAELIEELKRLNGTPPDVFEHSELLDLMIPVLRADFEASETWVTTENAILSCPLFALAGTVDPEATPAEVEPWSAYTSGRFESRIFSGDHFFLHGDWGQVSAFLASRLDRIGGVRNESNF